MTLHGHHVEKKLLNEPIDSGSIGLLQFKPLLPLMTWVVTPCIGNFCFESLFFNSKACHLVCMHHYLDIA
jgi:hypothetical protein